MYIEKLFGYCQKVLPLVYDDSLSYYELLCKCRDKINELIASNTDIDDYIAEHKVEYNVLNEKVEGLINSLVDVIVPWDSSVAYHIFSIVEYQGTNYIAIQDVPVGTMITNTDYWVEANTALQQINAIGVAVDDIKDVTDYYITPQHFGAVGDGDNDDYDAINAAIEYAIENHVTLLIPRGTYLISQALNYTAANGLYIKSSGGTIKADSGVTGSGQLLRFYQCNNICVEGLTLDVSNIQGCNAFGAEYCTNIKYVNCKAINCLRSGSTYGGGGFALQRSITDGKVIGCSAVNCSEGLNLGNDLNQSIHIEVDSFYCEDVETPVFCPDFHNPANIPATSGKNTVTICNCIFKNCGKSTTDESRLNEGASGDGTDGGIFVVYLTNGMNISNVLIINDSDYGTIGGVFRGSGTNISAENVVFEGACYAFYNFDNPRNILPVVPRESPIVSNFKASCTAIVSLMTGIFGLTDGQATGQNTSAVNAELRLPTNAGTSALLSAKTLTGNTNILFKLYNRFAFSTLGILTTAVANSAPVFSQQTMDALNLTAALLFANNRITESGGMLQLRHGNTPFVSTDANNDLVIPNGLWSGQHLVIGGLHVWANGGRLYWKNGAPANATDGTVI